MRRKILRYSITAYLLGECLAACGGRTRPSWVSSSRLIWWSQGLRVADITSSVAASGTPSYSYLEYQANALKRAIRLSDYLGEYAVSLSTWIPDDVALLTYLGGASSYGWFSLDQPTPGPLLIIPAKLSNPSAIHFPPAWPKLQ